MTCSGARVCSRGGYAGRAPPRHYWWRHRTHAEGRLERRRWSGPGRPADPSGRERLRQTVPSEWPTPRPARRPAAAVVSMATVSRQRAAAAALSRRSSGESSGAPGRVAAARLSGRAEPSPKHGGRLARVARHRRSGPSDVTRFDRHGAATAIAVTRRHTAPERSGCDRRELTRDEGGESHMRDIPQWKILELYALFYRYAPLADMQYSAGTHA